ncbi:hypothetical protein BGZ49_003763 [Haplosporangium sp. Z 27]|nr:hypothetical protein BGZ49_003763 [Haplosporangium sp. Z 27]
MYLLADFRFLEPKPIFPSSIATPHDQILFTDFGGDGVQLSRSSGGGVILQIQEIQDIGISSLKMLEACEAIGVKGDQPGGFLVDKTLPKGMLALDLTDGVRRMRALVMEPIAGIAIEMKMGAKIKVRDVQVRHGLLQLNPSNTLLLGGEVASMNQHSRRLVIMNQMKKKLGLPLDILPVVGNTPTITQPSMLISTSASNNTANTDNSSRNGNVNRATTNVWRNPQAAVRAQDSIPSTTSSNNLLIRNPVTNNETPNPWKTFKPTRHSISPEPDVGSLNERDDYMRMLEDQQPQWDFHRDMEIDDIGMPYDGADWEVMSNLSMDDTQRDLDKKNKQTTPEIVDTTSPVKKELTRKPLSLKSPHSRQQEKQRANSWEVETTPPVDYGSLKTTRSNGSDTDKVDKSPSLDIFNISNTSSPGADKFNIKTESGINRSRKSSPDLFLPMNLSQDTSNLKRHADSEVESSVDMERIRGNKRRVSPGDESDDEDFSSNRRRSRSFVPPPRIETEEDNQIKIKQEKTCDTLVSVKKEPFYDTYRDLGNITETASLIEYTRSLDFTGDTRSSDTKMPLVNVKVEKMAKRTDGASYHAAIELLSDDDNNDGDNDDDNDHSRGDRESASVRQDRSDADIPMKIKCEPDIMNSISSESIVKSELGYDSESGGYIKQEETLLEVDMDDDCDFGGLTEVTVVIPEVELDQVVESISGGIEVKAKARVHKLGKFSLTTIAVSIPIILLPVNSPVDEKDTITESEASIALTDFKVEAILDQPVVEMLMEYTLAQFRNLVRINEPEAKKAVVRMRSALSEVETVECHFKGMRGNNPVIRELTIISKKRR